MSFEQLHSIVDKLPYALRDQIISYAKSVDDAFTEIARDAKLARPEEAAERYRNDVILLSGIKKLLGLTAGSYWTLENAAILLERMDIRDITIGGRSFARGSELHASIHQVTLALENSLEKHGISDLQKLNPKEILERLVEDGDR